MKARNSSGSTAGLRAVWGSLVLIATIRPAAPAALGSTGHSLTPQTAEKKPLRRVELLILEDRANEVTVGLHIGLAKGWYLYWLNPGDAGLAPAVQWQLPPGHAARKLHHRKIDGPSGPLQCFLDGSPEIQVDFLPFLAPLSKIPGPGRSHGRRSPAHHVARQMGCRGCAVRPGCGPGFRLLSLSARRLRDPPSPDHDRRRKAHPAGRTGEPIGRPLHSQRPAHHRRNWLRGFVFYQGVKSDILKEVMT